MKQVTLNEEQLKALDAFLQEMPMKYAAPIVSFLNEAMKSQEAEVEMKGEETQCMICLEKYKEG